MRMRPHAGHSPFHLLLIPSPSSHAPAVAASAYLGESLVPYSQAPSQHNWQPPPSQWPSHVENPTSMRGSVEQRWMQQEFPQFNTSCSSQPCPSAAAAKKSPPIAHSAPLRIWVVFSLLNDLDNVTLQSAYQLSPAVRATMGASSRRTTWHSSIPSIYKWFWVELKYCWLPHCKFFHNLPRHCISYFFHSFTVL